MNPPKPYTSKSRDPVLALLYALVRDYVHVGDMERLVRDIELSEIEFKFDNGHLAEFAREILNRLWHNKRLKEVPPKP